MSVHDLAARAEFIRLVQAGHGGKALFEALPGHGDLSTYHRARRVVLGVPHRKDAKGRAKTGGLAIDRSAFVSDLHIPHQDRDVVRVVLAFLKEWRPTFVGLVGDVVDFYALSKFDKDPNRKLQLQDDLDHLDRFLTDLRETVGPDCKVVYVEGNHEARLKAFLWRNPEFCNLRILQPGSLLDLDKHNIEWVPQSRVYRHHGFIITHGTKVRAHSSYSAKAEFDRWGSSGLSGHTHRAGMYRRRTWDVDAVWYELGCLCELNPEYVVGAPDWQHGFAIGEFINGDQRFQITPVAVPNRKILWNGKLFE